MNKKYIYAILLFLFLIVSIIVFVIMNKEKKQTPNGAHFSSFIVTNFGSNSFVENEIAGLNFMVPENWDVVNDYLASFSMKTKDFIPFSERMISASVPKKGCWIGASVSFEKEGSNEDVFFSSNKFYINNPEFLGEDREIIQIDGIKALKEVIINKENNPGRIELVWVPFNDVVYFFETDLFGEDQEQCKIHFDNFLKTISIKQ
jgi:hypothetical protein